MQDMVTTAIVGAAGYTGQETLDRVLAHPQLELVAVGSNSLAGQEAPRLDPRLNRNGGKRVPRLVRNDEALAAGADLTFWCLSHEEAAPLDPPATGVVVDLSGAHRFADARVYDEWYGFAHPRTDGLGAWSYGLPEIAPATGRLVSNPGCYATAAILALWPIREHVDADSVVVDAKSGMTGAGRSLKASSHAGFVLENVSAYKVGSHQHAPEIAQAVGFPVAFTPHLLPIRRGLIATCYVRSTGADVRAVLEEHYAASHVVTVLPEGVTPELSRVQQTDAAELGVYEDRSTGRTIVVCALDNLGKGAAGQAMQNANLALGLDEVAGLRLSGVLV